MRIIFAGTPDFAAQILRALIGTEYEICAVYTKPDRPAGRGHKLTASPVKKLAIEHQLPIQQSINFKTAETKKIISSYQADLMIVAAYGVLLPQEILDTPKLGCINVHASLLPKWRGAAPIQRAILAGDHETGISIMQMRSGLDTGPVLTQAKCPINNGVTAQILHDFLALLGAKTLLEVLPNIIELQQHAKRQDNKLSCYACKLQKQETLIDWNEPAGYIMRQILAFNSWPVSQTIWKNKILKIWYANTLQINEHYATPGDIIATNSMGIDIATGDGVLRATQIQIPGKRSISVANFINANSIGTGEYLG
ncbi:MAG: methionyl-tRNA formyltransferase [Piscirickettsiaceae bacterium]|nr:methionyl-tRNA formyltransferase [Piscirickettsiaceae bacterium]